MDKFIKSVDTPEEAINVFQKLQSFLSKYGFKPKKWITNCNKLTKEMSEELRSISDTKQVEVEPSKVGSSVLGLQWTVTEDSLQVYRGSSTEAETPITQRKILSLVSSLFDPLGPFAQEFLKWEDQLSQVSATSNDRRDFKTAKDKWKLHV